MSMRLEVGAARAVASRLLEARESGIGFEVLIDRNFGSLEDEFLEIGAGLEASLHEQIWERSEDLRVALLDRGQALSYKGQDSDSLDVALEELMSSEVHHLLDPLESDLLHDAGFWRYLALFPFRWYLLTREPELKYQDFGGTDSNRDKWLMVRTYQWGRKCYQEGEAPPYQDAISARSTKRILGAPSGRIIDFYHSHIVRHRWADNSRIAHAFIQATAREPYVNDFSQQNRQVNEFSKRVNRVVSNLSVLTMSDQELFQVMESEKLRVLETIRSINDTI